MAHRRESELDFGLDFEAIFKKGLEVFPLRSEAASKREFLIQKLLVRIN